MKFRNVKFCSLIAVLGFALLAVMPASAGTLNMTGLPGFTYNGVYVGQAVGNLNGGTPFTLVCNDYLDTTYIPSSFNVNVSTIPTLAYAMYATHPTPTNAQVETYEWAAILLWQMGQPGNQTAGGIGSLNYAIWNLFNPAVPDPGSSSTWVTWVQGQNLAEWDYSGVSIYTPSDSHNQEFMSGSANPAPEPANMSLIGFGLLGMGIVGRRRLQRKAAAYHPTLYQIK